VRGPTFTMKFEKWRLSHNSTYILEVLRYTFYCVTEAAMYDFKRNIK